MSVDQLIDRLRQASERGQGDHPVRAFDPDAGSFEEISGVTCGGSTVEVYTDAL